MNRRPRFELPEFYVGWLPRLSPHVETARAHTKAWARRIGILDTPAADGTPEIWNEARFDAMDFALFAAYTYPDALPDELNLITDWLVWSFYYDDHFLEVFKRPRDVDGGHGHNERLVLFMPSDLATPPPEPSNPIERGLTDVWRRTAPARTVGWRRRLAQTVDDAFGAAEWELRNIDAARIANPIEYVEMRRRSGAFPWAALLIEHANLVEIPERIRDSRPMCVLRNTVSDAVDLHNDIFSYTLETKHEGELGNCVLVLERFFGLDAQAAAEMTNDILTSRAHQFEHTAATELPSLVAEAALTPFEVQTTLRYVKGLQDWQAGSLEWHKRARRYMNDAEPPPSPGGLTGLGTAGVRISAVAARPPRRPTANSTGLSRLRAYTHVPYQEVAPSLAVPDLVMSYTARVNAHRRTARDACVAWCREMGMLGGSGIWSEEQLDGFDFGLCAARIFPFDARAALDRRTCWLAWGAYADDYVPLVHARDLAGAQLQRSRLHGCMPLDCGSVEPAANPLEAGLADLWTQTAKPLPPTAREALRAEVELLLETWIWELANRIQHRLPDPVDYLEMRRRTARPMMMSLARITEPDALPPRLPATQSWLELERAAKDYATLVNDIFSLPKEMRDEGELHNLVIVAQSFLGIDAADAVGVVRDLANARIAQIEHIIATEIAGLADRFELGADGRETLARRVGGVEDWCAGMLAWHQSTARYGPAALGPRGLGTRGVRL